MCSDIIELLTDEIFLTSQFEEMYAKWMGLQKSWTNIIAIYV